MAKAVRVGLRNVIIPLTLAAMTTTVVSFLTNLLSPISAVGDFGVVAGTGRGAEPDRDADAGPSSANDR